MTIDSATYEAALDPSHPFNPLLRVTPYGGLWYIKNRIDMAPLEDLQVRRALAHGSDMRRDRQGQSGARQRTYATGLVSPLIPVPQPGCCEPRLRSRTSRDKSWPRPRTASADNLPPLLIDLAPAANGRHGHRGQGVLEGQPRGRVGRAQARERHAARRDASQFYRLSAGLVDSRPESRS